MRTVFLRALQAEDKPASLLSMIRESGVNRFDVDATDFSLVPRSPFAYWVPFDVRATFTSSPPFLSGRRLVVSTNPLNADFRFARLWWEVNACGLFERWRPWAKGGSYSPFYYDVDTVIAWDMHRSTYIGFLGTENRPLERPASVQHFFRPGLTWPRRTQSGLALRAMPSGCVFADKGPAAFVGGDDPDDLLTLLAMTNSATFRALVGLQMAFGSFEVGVIQRTPVPSIAAAREASLAPLAHRSWSLKRSLDTAIETSHAFTLPVLLQIQSASLDERAAVWSSRIRGVEEELEGIQAEIDERCVELYGIDVDSRRAITKAVAASYGVAENDDSVSEAEEVEDAKGDAVGLTAELVSWAVGAAFGRFDVRLATGERVLPDEPEPFDPLPVCSPAMLIGDDGLPLATAPGGYPLAFLEDGILVDDPGHSRDLTSAVRAVFDTVFGTNADADWSEAAELLDPKERDLRTWLAKSCFEYHLKRYSKSRRKAPILWQLATPSASYSVWVYAHRLTADSLFHIQNDVVAPKLALEERRQTALVQAAGPNPTASQRREITETDTFVGELRVLLSEVRLVAPLWQPDLNDGVVLTMAPLWRLVPQHRAWQRELKSAWDALCSGKYDWAQLAMHLWPERVVPKCAADRSLAIAHDLEEVFWIEDAKGKWQPRSTPTRPIEEIAGRRTSPAVKAALQSLLDAPAPAFAGRRSRARAGSARRGE